MTYKAHGTCAQKIDFRLENGKVYDVQFTGGCHGNQQGISKLAEGMDATEVIARLEGIKCGPRPTSCPDQLAKALKEALQ